MACRETIPSPSIECARVSLHRVDPRFVVPHRVRRAVVLGGLDDWRTGLVSAGVFVDEAQPEPPDLVVAPARLASEARWTGARSIILEGSSDRRSRADGYQDWRLLLRPDRARPTLALPLDQPAAVSYALERWSVGDRRWKAVRMRAARALASRGVFPSWASPIVTVASREPGSPALIDAAADLGVPGNARWFLTFGQGDALSRNAFQIIPAGGDAPAWVLKFARVAGYSHRFDDDERGLRLAHAAGGDVAARVPRLVGRFDVDGIHASVETAAVGTRVRDLLLRPGDRAAKLALVERIGAWIVELGRRTRSSPQALAPELARLRRDVIPAWAVLGALPALVDALPAVPAVAQHNDLGPWNVVADGSEFVVVDWENARGAAL